MRVAFKFMKQLFKRIIDDDVMGLSAQLAFFFLLSLFPFLLFLITLIGYLPMDEENFTAIIAMYAPAETLDLINSNIIQLMNQQNGGILSISIIGTLWSASNGINAIMKAFNRAYEVDEDRFFLVTRLIAIVLTIAMIAVICIALLLPVFGKMIGIYIFSFFGLSDDFIHVWNALRWVVTSIVFFIVFSALYILAPNRKVLVRDVLWGAAFATVSWQLVSLAFSYYVSVLGDFSAMYGSLGAVIVLMFWFYISGFIIIAGGLVNAALTNTGDSPRYFK